ncbi:CidA/LrgA family protein [Pyrococcus yayanosii]|uniref:LrgA n=1 Tax=Pyrococcus yayanosii (strain CH1 / JCM 16557) TaxID=529709 RepID=F8AHB8_PYRYC|nr:LrgA [Pyrococcus yayanosii CH1]
MFRGLAIIFGFLFLGQLLEETFNLMAPGSVIGMLFLLLALLTGLVKLEHVEREAEFLVRNMSIMFIPPGVGIIAYAGLLKGNIVPVSLALVGSFLLTLSLTGKLVELVRGGGNA